MAPRRPRCRRIADKVWRRKNAKAYAHLWSHGCLAYLRRKRTSGVKTYADSDGFLNVQALTCAQLANTFQEDADLLTTWYSGWSNELAKKHYINVPRSREAERETIVYCKAHQEVSVTKAIGHVFDEMRTQRGIILSK